MKAAVRTFSSGRPCQRPLGVVILWETNSVTLMWILGHFDFTGNSRADELAKVAPEEAFTSQEPMVCLAHRKARNIISRWCNEEYTGSWLKTPGMVNYCHGRWCRMPLVHGRRQVGSAVLLCCCFAVRLLSDPGFALLNKRHSGRKILATSRPERSPGFWKSWIFWVRIMFWTDHSVWFGSLWGQQLLTHLLHNIDIKSY